MESSNSVRLFKAEKEVIQRVNQHLQEEEWITISKGSAYFSSVNDTPFGSSTFIVESSGRSCEQKTQVVKRCIIELGSLMVLELNFVFLSGLLPCLFWTIFYVDPSVLGICTNTHKKPVVHSR